MNSGGGTRFFLQIVEIASAIFGSVMVVIFFVLALGALALAIGAAMFAQFDLRQGENPATPIGWAFGGIAGALFFLHTMRISSGPLAAFAIKDTGNVLVCKRAILPLLAMAALLAAVAIGLAQSYLESGLSEGAAIWFVATALLALAATASLRRLGRPLIVDEEGISDPSIRGGNIPLSDVVTALAWTTRATSSIEIVRRNGKSATIWAGDLAVAPQSVADAINRRIEMRTT